MSFFDSIQGLFGKKEKKISFDTVMDRPKDISEEDLNSILEKAKQGNLESSLLAGVLYLKGERIQQDPLKALDYLDKASRAGSLKAQKILAKEYLSGLVIPQDFKSAFDLFQKASYGDDIESIYYLGLMYEQGQFVAQDYNKAIECFQKAADLGFIKAKIEIANIYYEERPNAPTDRKKSCHIYKEILTGDLSTVDAGKLYFNLGKAYTEPYLQSDITKDEAISYLKRAIEKEYFEAIRLLAMMGEQLDDNDRHWLFTTASQNTNNPKCILAAGICYEYGYGTIADINEAFNHYMRASNMGDPWAKHYAANIYLKRTMTPEMVKEWVELESQAAINNIPAAQCSLGICYLHGDKVPQDHEKAIRLLQQAADNHDKTAQKVLDELKEIEELKAAATTQTNPINKFKIPTPETDTY